VTPTGLRRQDAIEVAQWLVARAGTPPGGVALIRWSNGGSTVLATARVAADLPVGLFQRSPHSIRDTRPRMRTLVGSRRRR
jgi:hypothetical protein